MNELPLKVRTLITLYEKGVVSKSELKPLLNEIYYNVNFNEHSSNIKPLKSYSVPIPKGYEIDPVKTDLLKGYIQFRPKTVHFPENYEAFSKVPEASQQDSNDLMDLKKLLELRHFIVKQYGGYPSHTYDFGIFNTVKGIKVKEISSTIPTLTLPTKELCHKCYNTYKDLLTSVTHLL